MALPPQGAPDLLMTSLFVFQKKSVTVFSLITVIMSLLLVLLPFVVPSITGFAKGGALPTFNYGEALQKAIYFYEEQSSGPKPFWNRVPWIGSSAVHDGSDVGLNLTGGWYTSGNHVKFGLPMAYAATMLAWGVIAYRQAYARDGQLGHLLYNLSGVDDYFLRAHPAPNVLYGQVGNLGLDDVFWGPAEVMQMARPSYKIDANCPGSDLAGETAAALAASSIALLSVTPAYAFRLLVHAKQLYAFADQYRGKYNDCIPAASVSYPSSGYNDELVWGALWLYLATHDPSYLTKAEAYYTTMSHGYQWTINWDDVSYGCYVLLAEITGQQQYRDAAQHWLDWWTVGVNGSKVPYSPGGEAFLTPWGSLRYSANTAFMALVYADYLGKQNALYARYHDFAVQQINYILGANPRHSSYMVGFGTSYPQVPHQRDAHDSWLNDINTPTYNRHILYGALVGGPNAADDAFTDNRQDFQTNEPAADFNAALTGALARLYQEYRGYPLGALPDKPKDDDEIYVMASVTASEPHATEIEALFVNKSGWPARVTSNLSLRYYFTLGPGVSPEQITVSLTSTECGNQLSGPTHYAGRIYYLTVSCAGTLIYPGGPQAYQKQVRFRISSTGDWDPTNDWSYPGIAAPGQAPVKTKNIQVYDGTTLQWGEPPATTNEKGESPW